MRLNCALVPSFLFVSAVLAGNHQPPFLDLVEESINSTDFVIDNLFWAGAMSQEGNNNNAVGNFIVPSATWSASGGSSFDIVVGINGRTCGKFIISVGITVKSQGGSTFTYEAWAQGFDGEKIIHPSFTIRIGDEMRAEVEIESPTSGSFRLINLKTNLDWGLPVSGKNMDCDYSDAAWIVTTSVPNLLPTFRPVAFMDISTSPRPIPVVPNIYILRNIRRPLGNTITAAVLDGPFVIIVRLPR